jgi:hypothetical protein
MCFFICIDDHIPPIIVSVPIVDIINICITMYKLGLLVCLVRYGAGMLCWDWKFSDSTESGTFLTNGTSATLVDNAPLHIQHITVDQTILESVADADLSNSEAVEIIALLGFHWNASSSVVSRWIRSAESTYYPPLFVLHCGNESVAYFYNGPDYEEGVYTMENQNDDVLASSNVFVARERSCSPPVPTVQNTPSPATPSEGTRAPTNSSLSLAATRDTGGVLYVVIILITVVCMLSDNNPLELL